MSEYAATNNERMKAQTIRNQYVDKKEGKMDQLNRLDKKVKAPGKIITIILGIGGSLLMGAGMATIMVWNTMGSGLAMGIPGMAIAMLAYPIYKLITGRRKKKYAKDIMMLSDELLA